MAFPTNPTNGQQTTQNGILYTYNATLGVWSVLTNNTGGDFGANNITATNSITGTTLTVSSATVGTLQNTGNILTDNLVANLSMVTSSLNTSNIVVSNNTSVSGNLTVGKFTNLGNLGNITITGGSVGYVIATDGSGNLSWAEGGGGATGGGTDEVFLENDQVVTTDYTIPATKNAMSTGPVEIDDGVVITVSSGSRWVII
jgi:hypothetical protein